MAEIFDLTPEQQFFIKKTAEAAADAALERLTNRDCPFPCARVAANSEELSKVKTTLFGPYDHPGGLVDRLGQLEARMRLLVWLAALSLGTTLTATAYAISSIIARHIH